MAAVLSVKNLRKVYPGKKPHVAVDGVSFDLKPGEILGLLGPNGSGKTTTIQMLLGTLDMTAGSIFYFGKDFLTCRSASLQSVAFASTYTSLPYTLTIRENLDVFGCFYGLSPKESRKRYMPLLERFGIMDKLNTRVGALSAGQVTRLVLTKAFFTDPQIVLLDEPTASLDPDMAQEICAFILEQRKKRNVSILFTSHKMHEATMLCDRVIFLQEGKVIADDLPQNLAKSVSGFQLKLTISDGMKRTVALLEKRGFSFKVEHRVIEISLDESVIPSLLNQLGKEDIVYSGIKIEEPSLENYFLQIARRKR